MSETRLPTASVEVAVYDEDWMPEVIGSGPATVTVLTTPGITVTVLPPDLAGAATEVAVMITVPTMMPVSLSALRLAEPVPSVLIQVNVSETVLLFMSLETAVYDDDSTPDVMLLEPATATVAITPGRTVTVLPPDLAGAATEVAVIVTVPARTPVSLSTLRVAVPVPSVLIQVNVSETVLLFISFEIAVYDEDSMPEVIGSGPEIVTVAIEPGRTVTTCPPALAGAETEVAVIVTVPARMPVSLLALRLAEPVPLALVQV